MRLPQQAGGSGHLIVRLGDRRASYRCTALSLAKVELYRALRDDAVCAAELADRLGVQTSVIERMLDLNQRTALPEIEAAFRALGRRLGIEVSAAA